MKKILLKIEELKDSQGEILKYEFIHKYNSRSKGFETRDSKFLKILVLKKNCPRHDSERGYFIDDPWLIDYIKAKGLYLLKMKLDLEKSKKKVTGLINEKRLLETAGNNNLEKIEHYNSLPLWKKIFVGRI